MILVGSTYFFGHLDGFVSKDKDYVELVDNPTDFHFRKESYHLEGEIDIFQYKRCGAEEFIHRTLQLRDALTVGKFLVKEFAEEIGLDIKLLKRLTPLIYMLDEKHNYEKIIFDWIIENKTWDLSAVVIEMAYNSYKITHSPIV